MTDAAIPAGQEELSGKRYMRDAKGSLIPLELVKPADRMMDDLVRQLLASASAEAARLAAFKATTFAEVDAFLELLADQHKVTIGGVKGNITLQTIDGLMRVQVAVADRFEWGPKLQVAKAAIDGCVRAWGVDSAPELFAIVEAAFKVDKEGKVNSGALFGLLRLNITDTAWVEGMAALRDSMMVTGSRRYVRFYQRPNTDARFESVSLDLATA